MTLRTTDSTPYWLRYEMTHDNGPKEVIIANSRILADAQHRLRNVFDVQGHTTDVIFDITARLRVHWIRGGNDWRAKLSIDRAGRPFIAAEKIQNTAGIAEIELTVELDS